MNYQCQGCMDKSNGKQWRRETPNKMIPLVVKGTCDVCKRNLCVTCYKETHVGRCHVCNTENCCHRMDIQKYVCGACM